MREWLQRGLVSGTASDARLRLAGNLADFPFADGKGGQFLVTAKAQGVTLDYAEQWPQLTAVDADVRFEGAHMSIDARKAQVFDVPLSGTKVEIANLRAAIPLLSISGEASGPTVEFLRFIAESPVAGWIDHVTDGAEASGTGKLALKLELPLGKPADNHVSGEYTFAGNRVQFAGGVPALNHLNGTLAFTGHEMLRSLLTGEVLGGPARFTIGSEDGHLHLAGQGHADVAQVRVEYPQQPLAKRISGTADWQLAIVDEGVAAKWSVDSNLTGVAIDLPPPLKKTAAEAVPLQFERRAGDGERDTVVVRYGRIGQLTLQRRLAAAGAKVERGLLVLGGAGRRPGSAGPVGARAGRRAQRRWLAGGQARTGRSPSRAPT